MELVKAYQKQGRKTFAVLVVKRTSLFIVTIVIVGVALYVVGSVPQKYGNAVYALIPWLLVFAGLTICAAIVLGWLEYVHYHIFIYDDYLKVTKGVIAEEEVGVPYKLIKEVEVERDIVGELFGFSNIIVTVLGEESAAVFSKESTISLPFLDKQTAAEIQNLILERTDIQKSEVTQPAA